MGFIMSFVWDTKIVLVTGANRGIGLGLVKALIARQVKRVYLAGRDLMSVEQIIASLDGGATELVPILLDVTKQEHIETLASLVPSLDVLINNAGIASGSGFVNALSDNLVEQEMATNYFGPVKVTRALLPVLLQSPQGALVNVSSIAGLANMPLLAPYSASKAALHSFTQGVRAELAKSPLLVQGVYPGPVDTRLAEGFELAKAAPLDVAELVLSAIENGVEDVFPDDMSANWYATFSHNPKQLEKEFAAWLG